MNFFQNHNFFSKSRIFKNHEFFKITLFQKSRDFKITRFQNHIISKITRFQNHAISKSQYFKNHAISKSRDFLGFLTIFKTSVFFKNSPFKIHFGIPRLTICKKPVFSLQDLGFRLGNMFQTHIRTVIDRVSILFFKKLSKISVYLHRIKFHKNVRHKLSTLHS